MGSFEADFDNFHHYLTRAFSFISVGCKILYKKKGRTHRKYMVLTGYYKNQREQVREIRENSKKRKYKKKVKRTTIMSEIIVEVLEHLGTSAVEDIAPYFGGKIRLKEFIQTLSMICARLPDVERRIEADEDIFRSESLESLKLMLHCLLNLLKEIMNGKPQGKLYITFPVLCSRPSSFKKYKKDIEDIIKALEAVRSDMGIFWSREREVRGEIHSFVREEDMIGREDAKNEVIGKLLHSGDVGENLSVITLVGVAGVGKTTLAQLIFDDKEVEKHFNLRAWVCLTEFSSLEDVIRKILQCITGDDCHQLSWEQLQARLTKAISGKKYLLVLDDIQNEPPQTWIHLKSLLSGGIKGSKIMATSRYRQVASVMGMIYELKGLSNEKSWELFKSLAFEEGQEERNPNLTAIGKQIIEKCANVPLALKTLAYLAYARGPREMEWMKIRDGEFKDYIATLKPMYDGLRTQLKNCFTYFSLFPKGYQFNKRDLIYLWMAQGYILSSSNGISMEDAGDEYFKEFHGKSFFRDVGEPSHCKMHELMTDLARNLGRDKCLVDRPTDRVSDNILHVSFIVDSSWEAPSWLLDAKQMRSLLLHSQRCGCKTQVSVQSMDKIFTSLRDLRAMDLANVDCEKLPDSIGELEQLRYLKLGVSSISLPESIKKLQNLQTLDLRTCDRLRELPAGFSKLINLRHLHVKGTLIDMPPGLGQLTSLHRLDLFIVGESNGLDALGGLDKIAGNLEIHFAKRHEEAVSKAKAANLKGKKLTGLVLRWSSSYPEPTAQSDEDEDQSVLQCLQPHENLKALEVIDWKGLRFPWNMYRLTNLTSIKIVSCQRCVHLPLLSRLPNLVYLQLWDLEALEYIEIDEDTNKAGFPATFYPSLTHLELYELHELKGWSKENSGRQRRENSEYLVQSLLPKLSVLRISRCPKLSSMPVMLSLESLDAQEIHGKLLRHLLNADYFKLRNLQVVSIQELDSLSINQYSLKSLTIKRCKGLIELMLKSPSSLRRLEIENCGRLTNISAALKHLFTLEELVIRRCEELSWRDESLYHRLAHKKKHGGGDSEDDDEGDGDGDLNLTDIAELGLVPSARLERLKRLSYLGLMDMKELRPLPSAHQGHLSSLRSLTLTDMVKLELLPKELASLTTVRELYISWLYNLRALPQWIGQLRQLHRLDIRYCHKLSVLPRSLLNLRHLQCLRIVECPKLERKCRQPDGKYVLLIKDIPDVVLGQPV